MDLPTCNGKECMTINNLTAASPHIQYFKLLFLLTRVISHTADFFSFLNFFFSDRLQSTLQLAI